MNNVCKKQGSGWTEYVWPKPGEKEVSNKVSYVKMAKYKDAEGKVKEFVVGCGVYDWDMKLVAAELEKLKAEKAKEDVAKEDDKAKM